MQTALNKIKLLDVLQQHQRALSLSEISQLLPQKVADRTLRRWLSELESEHKLRKLGQKRGTRYQASLTQGSAIWQKHSLKAIQASKRPLYERQPTAYDRNWLEAYRPNHAYYLNAEQRLSLQQQGRQTTDYGDVAGTYARHIYQRLLIDLSYNSSRLEGNTYSLADTEKLLLSGIANSDKLNSETVMILNHKDAIEHLVNRIEAIQLNQTEIFTLHYLLADGLVTPQYAGKLRDHGVRIVGSSYVPLESQQALEKQLAQITNKAQAIVDPFEQSFFLLIHLSYLQAFIDVNKRTARLAANIPLIKHNLVPLAFKTIEKDDYLSAMITVYEQQQTAPLADLYAYSYQRTCLEYNAVVETMAFDEIRIRYRQQRRELIQRLIHQQLSGKTLKTFIREQSQLLIPERDQQAFTQTLHEDLTHIDRAQINGMGISRQEFNTWLKKQ